VLNKQIAMDARAERAGKEQQARPESAGQFVRGYTQKTAAQNRIAEQLQRRQEYEEELKILRGF